MARDGVARLVHRLADPTGYDRATDRELLGWFAEDRDERAFEALVRRHGRLVRSAASRVLADPNDVDDAIHRLRAIGNRARCLANKVGARIGRRAHGSKHEQRADEHTDSPHEGSM